MPPTHMFYAAIPRDPYLVLSSYTLRLGPFNLDFQHIL